MENNNKKQPNFSRPFNSKNSQSADSKRKTDLQAKYAFPRAPRRRDQQPQTNRNEQQRNSKQLPAKQRPNVDKRPRARGGSGFGSSGSTYLAERDVPSSVGNDAVPTSSTGLVDDFDIDDASIDDYADFVDFEDVHLNSDNNSRPLHASARKARQNFNHLLNFRCDFRDGSDLFGRGGLYGVFNNYGNNNNRGVGGGGTVNKKHNNSHKYNKEQFLQANFQFVIKSSVKPQLFTSPDNIVDWSLIEQINIQTSEEPRCPICLYPPVAAKLTRCGHAYCWPCILHYLALNDKTWRKCPICYEAIHVNDLKSCAILQQRTLNVNDDIKFQLMRRKKGSFFIEKFSTVQAAFIERYPQYSGNSDIKPFSKFLLAKRSDILTIIERERAELIVDDDTSCAEYVFVQQALNLLNERREQLGDIQMPNKEEEEHHANEQNDASVKKEVNDAEDNLSTCVLENVTENQLEVDVHNTSVVSLANFDSQSACSADLNNFVQQQKYYYFYQSVDGQNIFLHPLNVKMLQSCYGSLEFAPLTINGRILQKECHTMDEELRRKFTCLGHLPLTCQFAVVEVDLQAPIVSVETLNIFKDNIKHRQLQRERRDREEKKREKKIAAINDRQMGKLIAKAANLNLSSAQEFPVCGFGFDLIPPAGTSANSFAATTMTAKAEINSTAEKAIVSTQNVSGSPPGPSYSSIIMSQENSKVNNSGLFPELSLGAKVKKCNNNNNVSNKLVNSGRIQNMNVPVEVLENDAGDTVKSLGTTFGDVMDQAIARKKASSSSNASSNTTDSSNSHNNVGNNGGGGGKKQKREKKKMVPLLF